MPPTANPFETALTGESLPFGSDVLSRLAQLFASQVRTGYAPEVDEQFRKNTAITSSHSASPTVRIVTTDAWRKRLLTHPALRESLQEAFGNLLSGSYSADQALSNWAAVLRGSALLRIVSDGHMLEVDTSDVGIRPVLPSTIPHEEIPSSELSTNVAESSHVRLARELREMTGLGAGKLAESLGVSREQYSRWVGGAAISDVRHGQLRYLHTVMADLVRKLDLRDAQLWIQTPTSGDVRPVDLLVGRRWTELHRLVAAVPDPAPLVDGVRVSLLAPLEDEDDNSESTEEVEGEGSWSPYTS